MAATGQIGPGEAMEVAVVLTGLGLAGAAGTWWPLRAWSRAGRGDASRCALLALAYLALLLPAWLRGVGMPTPEGAWLPYLLSAGSLLMAAATLLTILSFGLIEDPGIPAFLYAAVLLVGAALTWIKRPPSGPVLASRAPPE